LNSAVLEDLLEARRGKRPAVLATRLESGEQALLFPLDPDTPALHREWPTAAAADALRSDRSGVVEHDGERVFLRPYNPPVRLIVVGAVHVSQPLAQLATIAGIEVTVVDPRSAFASAERFPGTLLDLRWPNEAVPGLNPDHRTAIVTLTHDPKLDDPALEAALDSDAFYIGALGSRKTHQKRLARLREGGTDERSLQRIKGPIGLDIGARTPAEIAVAILAELIGHLRGAATAP
jgi:xanthine dehydrogenase accessory factor